MKADTNDDSTPDTLVFEFSYYSQDLESVFIFPAVNKTMT